jgi:hypothetical protein
LLGAQDGGTRTADSEEQNDVPKTSPRWHGRLRFRILRVWGNGKIAEDDIMRRSQNVINELLTEIRWMNSSN